MVHRLSCRLAAYCVAHDLIDRQHFPHLQYKAEILLRTAFFALLLVGLALITGQYLPIGVYALTTHAFRKHMGGWHAPQPWLCQLMSFGIILLATLLLGPWMARLPKLPLLCLALALDALMAVLPPAYPPQLHLSQEEARGNIRRKNQFLIFTLLIQFAAFFWLDLRIIVYTFLGLATTVSTVLLEKILRRKKG